MNKPPCDACDSACCKNNFRQHDFAVGLTDSDDPSLFPDAIDVVHDGIEGKALPYVNGSCVRLGEDGKCTQYDGRPKLCRDFDCRQGYLLKGKIHGFFLEDNPHVVQLIELHCAEFVAVRLKQAPARARANHL